MLRRSIIIALVGFLPAIAAAQDPHVAANAPKDRTVAAVNDTGVARMDSLIAPYVAQARASYPDAKAKFLRGLPADESFFLTTRLHDQTGRFEQVFIAVDSIAAGRVYGRIWSQIAVVQGYRLRQPYSFPESEMMDWLITHPDGTEEGNFVGKFMDTLQQ